MAYGRNVTIYASSAFALGGLAPVAVAPTARFDAVLCDGNVTVPARAVAGTAVLGVSRNSFNATANTTGALFVSRAAVSAPLRSPGARPPCANVWPSRNSPPSSSTGNAWASPPSWLVRDAVFNCDDVGFAGRGAARNAAAARVGAGVVIWGTAANRSATWPGATVVDAATGDAVVCPAPLFPPMVLVAAPIVPPNPAAAASPTPTVPPHLANNETETAPVLVVPNTSPPARRSPTGTRVRGTATAVASVATSRSATREVTTAGWTATASTVASPSLSADVSSTIVASASSTPLASPSETTSASVSPAVPVPVAPAAANTTVTTAAASSPAVAAATTVASVSVAAATVSALVSDGGGAAASDAQVAVLLAMAVDVPCDDMAAVRRRDDGQRPIAVLPAKDMLRAAMPLGSWSDTAVATLGSLAVLPGLLLLNGLWAAALQTMRGAALDSDAADWTGEGGNGDDATRPTRWTLATAHAKCPGLAFALSQLLVPGMAAAVPRLLSEGGVSVAVALLAVAVIGLFTVVAARTTFRVGAYYAERPELTSTVQAQGGVGSADAERSLVCSAETIWLPNQTFFSEAKAAGREAATGWPSLLTPTGFWFWGGAARANVPWAFQLAPVFKSLRLGDAFPPADAVRSRMWLLRSPLQHAVLRVVLPAVSGLLVGFRLAGLSVWWCSHAAPAAFVAVNLVGVAALFHTKPYVVPLAVPARAATTLLLAALAAVPLSGKRTAADDGVAAAVSAMVIAAGAGTALTGVVSVAVGLRSRRWREPFRDYVDETTRAAAQAGAGGADVEMTVTASGAAAAATGDAASAPLLQVPDPGRAPKPAANPLA